MRKILLLAAALALTIGATAQEKPFTYGLKAGINIAQISSGTVDNGIWGILDFDALDMKIGFFVSGHVNYSFGQFFGIQPELSFSMQGGKQSWTDDLWGSGSSTLYLNYINIPVLFEVKPITNLSLFVGPQIGFNIYKSATTNTNGETIFRGNVNAKTIDFAAVVGLQYAILGKYLISARYNIGFTSVFDDNISGRANRVIQIGVGYQF